MPKAIDTCCLTTLPKHVVMVGANGNRQAFQFLSELGPEQSWAWVLEMAQGEFKPVRVGDDLFLLPTAVVWGHA